MNNLYIIISNLFYFSIAIIPFIIIHCIIFQEKMSKKKLIISIFSSIFIMPLIAITSGYITAFKQYDIIKDAFFIGNSALYILGYIGLIAINYFIFLIIKLKKEEKYKKQKSKFIIIFLILCIMIYLSIPTFLLCFSLSSKNINTQISTTKLALKLSTFPYTKGVLAFYTGMEIFALEDNKENIEESIKYSELCYKFLKTDSSKKDLLIHYLRGKKYEEALKIALELKDKNINVESELIQIYIELNKIDEALKVSNNPIKKAFIYRKIKDYDKAIENINKLNKHNVDLYLNRAIIYEEMGEKELAEQDIKKIKELRRGRK